MKRSKNILWWGLFFALAIILQRLLPGLDFLVVGLIIALQEKNRTQTAWIVLISILLQEGQGTMDFGVAVCWYGATMLIYYIGRAIFETENIFFLVLVCLSLGILHFGLMYILAGLQNITPPMERLVRESIEEMLVVPLLWFVLHKARPEVKAHAD